VISEDVPVLVILIVPPTFRSTALKSLVEMVNPFNPADPPTSSVKVTSPVPFVVIDNVCAPFVVEPNDTEPLDVVVKVLSADNCSCSSIGLCS
jgi:hypothetical protein